MSAPSSTAFQDKLNLAINYHQSGQIAAAEALYKKILQRKPKHADALHLYGVLLSQQGKIDYGITQIKKAIALKPRAWAYHNSLGNVLLDARRSADAIGAYRHAIELKPDYVEAHSNLGIALQGQGKLDEAIDAYRKAIAIDPRHAQAHYNLGNALRAKGELAAAADAYRAAIAANNRYLNAYNNLGMTLLDSGADAEAIDSFQQCMAIAPNNPRVLINLGTAQLRKRRYADATASFARAAELDPASADAPYNLGLALREQGRLTDALQAFRASAERNPSRYSTLRALATTHFALQQPDQWHALLERAAQLPGLAEGEREDLMVYRAIDAWLRLDLDACRTALEASRALRANTSDDISVRFRRAYHVYLGQLVEYRTQHPEVYRGAHSVTLYAIGDSHCLTAHDIVVTAGGRTLRTEVRLIIGCKAFHLAKPENNRFKAAFDAALSSLPQGVTALINFGEIDCRHNEGIYPYLNKHPQQAQPFVRQLTDDYVQYVAAAAARKGIEVIFCGVPAPNYDIGALTEQEQARFLEIVRLFNESLKDSAAAQGKRMVDVYAATASHSGRSNGQHHLDDYHLTPDTLRTLLQQTPAAG